MRKKIFLLPLLIVPMLVKTPQPSYGKDNPDQDIVDNLDLLLELPLLDNLDLMEHYDVLYDTVPADESADDNRGDTDENE